MFYLEDNLSNAFFWAMDEECTRSDMEHNLTSFIMLYSMGWEI